ncbi:hypothetical protein ACJ41O_013739 [Fusarium nematophilum]
MAKTRRQILQEHFAGPENPLRPILTSLNGDNSWLMSFPRPQSEQVSVGKAFYHVVFEPWLKGSTSVFSPWLVKLTMSADPAIPDPEAIQGVIQEIEDAAADHMSPSGQERSKQGASGPGVDAILLGFHFSDHLHEATLRLFDPSIPVIASPEAAGIVRPWNHFKTIKLIQDLGPSAESWRSPELHPGDPLPSWLTPIRLPGHAVLNYCLAIVWTHPTDTGDEAHEVILQSPHGTRLGQGPLDAFLNAHPKTAKLAMLHGLKESHTFGSQTTLGARGGLAFYRKVGGVKHWVVSHNSRLLYEGFIMWLSWTNDTGRTLEWSLEEERKNSDGTEEREVPNVVQVDNGGLVVLTA